MNKGYFYKFLTSVGTGVEKTNLNYDEPIIEHNIPESYIIDCNSLKCKYFETQNQYWLSHYWGYCSMYLTEDDFNIISDKIVFPSFFPYFLYFEKYIGAIIVRCEYGDIITYLYRESDKIILKPVRRFKKNESKNYDTCGKLPNRSIKVFLTKEEFEVDEKKKKEKNDARRKKDRELAKYLTRQAPVFSFTTPKFKVLEVVKKTAYLPDIKVGDIVYGEIPVIKGNDDRKCGSMEGIGTRTNWISIFINGTKVNSISLVTFPSLFFNNIVVEEV